MNAIYIKRSHVLEIRIENTLDALQKAVNGYIEAVTLVPDEAVMIVNEEGVLRRMYPNIIASAIAGTHIVGDALIVGVDGEEFTDLPLEVARHILARFRTESNYDS